MADALEEGIYSLETFPYRGADRRIGAFAHRGYRQIHVHNFTAVYRIDEQKKCVIIVTVRYAMSSFLLVAQYNNIIYGKSDERKRVSLSMPSIDFFL